MFDRNKSGDYVTRVEADDYIRDLKRQAGNSFVSRDDAATYSRALNALEERVQELENLASQVRQGGASARTVSTPVAGRVSASDALTKSDAEQALAQLKREGAEQFRQLGAKIDALTADQPVNYVPTDERGETSDRSAVDYGAIAYGLSEIKNAVQSELGNAHLGGGVRISDYYRGAVQYFADVLAKSDASFDADAFKRQSGV